MNAPNTTPSPTAATPATPHTVQAVDTRTAFHAALLQTLQGAVARSARQLWLADRDFVEWPLDDPAWLDALTVFVRAPQRRLTLIGERFDGLRLHRPRFVEWRRTWAHAVQAWTPEPGAPAVPTLLVDDGPLILRLQDGERWRGWVGRDPHEARRARDELEALLQRSEAAFPVTTLGI